MPVVDISELLEGKSSGKVQAEIAEALGDFGFMYVTGCSDALAAGDTLFKDLRSVLARPNEYKAQLAMSDVPLAWRGWFALGEELTGGVADLKEGIYFGQEHPPEHPECVAGTPMHGLNRLPPTADYPELPAKLQDYFRECERVGNVLMQAITAAVLGPERVEQVVAQFDPQPFSLFRIFHYPAAMAREQAAGERFGVAEHTDYGCLTILRQDEVGGLEVLHRTTRQWIDAPPIKDTLLVNVGDALQVITGGKCRSTPHRVRNTSGRSRYSMPFFYDPAFNASLPPPPNTGSSSLPQQQDALGFDGSVYAKLSAQSPDGSILWRDYILAKTAKVFPQLLEQVVQQ